MHCNSIPFLAEERDINYEWAIQSLTGISVEQAGRAEVHYIAVSDGIFSTWSRGFTVPRFSALFRVESPPTKEDQETLNVDLTFISP